MRALLLFYAGVMACLFVLQGIYILKTGSVGGVFARFVDKSRSATKPTVAMRVYCATLYIVCGAALIALLLVTAVRHHLTSSSIMEHLKLDYLDLLWPFGLIAGGVYGVVQPAGVVGWVKHAHPDLERNDPNAVLLVRVIGAGICAIGVVILCAFVS